MTRLDAYVARFLSCDLDPSDDALRGILLVGPGGSGKTTAVRQAVQQVGTKAAIQYVSGSPLVSALRKILEALPEDGRSIVILEECENLSRQATTTLKDAISTRPRLMIIGTSNHPDRIDDALRSRFTVFHFDAPTETELAQAADHYWRSLSSQPMPICPRFRSYRHMRQWLRDEADGILHAPGDDAWAQELQSKVASLVADADALSRDASIELAKCASLAKLLGRKSRRLPL